MKNRKIVITGSSKGIGKAIAKKFAQDDCEIYLISSNEKTLTDTSFSVFSLEEIRYISQSSWANLFAIAFPIPLLEPVITIFLSFINSFHKFDNVLTLL